MNYPNQVDFFKILDCLKFENVGYVEIGIPVENPYVDGEIIQAAHKEVLKNGLTTEIIEETLVTIKKTYSFKVILMTYESAINNFELEKLDKSLYDGIICVDKKLQPKSFSNPIHIFNESLSDEEIQKMSDNSSLFNYVMSGQGQTGSFNSVPEEYLETIKRIKKFNSKTKNFVGFGIKSKEDITKVIKNGSDGAIIGTEFLKQYVFNGLSGVKNYLKELN